MRPHSHNCGEVVGTRRVARALVVGFAAALLIGAGSLRADDNIADQIQQARSGFKPVS